MAARPTTLRLNSSWSILVSQGTKPGGREEEDLMSDRPRIDLDILRSITDRLRRANEAARRIAGPERVLPPMNAAESAAPLARRIRRAQ
ncbi:hypothetical protein L3i22_029840 [Actinoplanes sp. L3-i22]|nr:hypothetical protein L3i22_029840 [Actinoplanes sp. L3-i22]